MRLTSWHVATMQLLLFLLQVASAEEIGSLRESQMEAVNYTPDSLGETCMAIIRSTPRYHKAGAGGPASLPVLQSLDDITEDGREGRMYVEGMLINFIICTVFSFLALFSWMCFCTCRCCCNTCGGRTPSHRYDTSVKVTKVGIGFMMCVFVVFCGLGIVSNAGISKSATNFIIAIDKFFGHLDVLNSHVEDFQELTADTYQTLKILNDTIHTVIPSEAQVDSYQDCIVEIFDLIETKDNITARLVETDTVLDNLVNFTLLADSLNALATGLNNFPNVYGVERSFIDLNASLSLDLNSFSNDLTTFNNSMSSIQSKSNLGTDLDNTHTDLIRLNGTVIVNNLANIETGISILPDLNSLSNGVADKDTTDFNTLSGQLRALNVSLDAFPNAALHEEQLVQLDNTLSVVTSSTTQLQTDIALVRTAASWMPIDALLYHFQSLSNLLASFSVNAYLNQLDSVTTGISSLPDVSSLLAQVSQLDISIASLNALDIDSVSTSMLYLNQSLPEIECVNDLFAALRTINNTLIILPADVDSILDQEDAAGDMIAQIPFLQRELSKGIMEIQALNTSWTTQLSGINDLSSSLTTFNQSIAELSDLTSTRQALVNLNASLAGLSDLDLNNYVAQVSTVNNTVVTAVNSLNDWDSYLTSVSALLAQIPALSPYISSAEALNTSTYNLITNVNEASAFIHSAAYPASDIPASISTPLISKIHSLNTTVLTRPNSTELQVSLLAIDTAISSFTSPTVSETSTELNTMQSTLDTFPNVHVLQTELAASHSTIGLTQPYLYDLLDGTLQAVNTSLSSSSFSDLNNQEQELRAAQGSVNNVDLDAVVSELQQADFELTDVNEADMLTQLDNIDQYRSTVPLSTITDSATEMRDLSEQMQQRYEDIDELYSKYYDKRDEYWEKVIGYDELRITIMNILIGLPLVVSLCGVGGCICKKGTPSMVMALWYFPLAMLFFLFAGVTIPWAQLLSDHCQDFDHVVVERQMNSRTIKAESFGSFFNVSQDLDMFAFWDYMAHCNGEKPEIITKMEDTDALLKRVGVNFTTIRNDVVYNEEGLTIHPDIVASIDSIMGVVDGVQLVADETVADLSCSTVSSLIEPFVDTLCIDLGRALASATCLYFLMAFCMLPASIFGIMGYKRFYSLNHEVWEEDDDDIDDDNMKEDDGAIQMNPLQSRGQQNELRRRKARLQQSMARDAGIQLQQQQQQQHFFTSATPSDFDTGITRDIVVSPLPIVVTPSSGREPRLPNSTPPSNITNRKGKKGKRHKPRVPSTPPPQAIQQPMVVMPTNANNNSTASTSNKNNNSNFLGAPIVVMGRSSISQSRNSPSHSLSVSVNSTISPSDQSTVDNTQLVHPSQQAHLEKKFNI